MEHHHHDHHHSSKEVSNIRMAFFLNFIFTLLEIAGGIYTNSVAIMSDALHDLGDSLSLGLAWYFQKLSSKKRDGKFSFGYRRFSLLGAIVNSIVLVIGSILILYETIPRIIEPVQADAKGMIIFAVLGIIVNGAAVLRLKKGSSINSKVIALHLIEDVLGWVAVLIGSIIMLYKKIPVLDAILALMITMYILFNVFKSFKHSFRVLLQGVPTDLDVDEIKNKISEGLKGVTNIHDVHVWSLDGEYNILTMHIVVDQMGTPEETKKIKLDARAKLGELGVHHATIEIETSDEDCGFQNC